MLAPGPPRPARLLAFTRPIDKIKCDAEWKDSIICVCTDDTAPCGTYAEVIRLITANRCLRRALEVSVKGVIVRIDPLGVDLDEVRRAPLDDLPPGAVASVVKRIVKDTTATAVKVAQFNSSI